MPSEAFVGLGSNIEPERHLRDALEAIHHRFASVETSRVYRNAAVGFEGDDFLNMVIRLECTVPPAALEGILAAIERAGGRRRSASPQHKGGSRHAPAIGSRTLDLDLLLYGSLVDPELRLPRSDVLRYVFVLRPLAELAPDLIHPVTGRSMRTEWEKAAGQGPRMEPVDLFSSA